MGLKGKGKGGKSNPEHQYGRYTDRKTHSKNPNKCASYLTGIGRVKRKRIQAIKWKTGNKRSTYEGPQS